jgi:protein-tyrosine phosphatase
MLGSLPRVTKSSLDFPCLHPSFEALGHVELHFHLLPGIDDGPRSVAESVELAAAAVADGTSTVVATPHVHPIFVTDPRELPARVDELSEALRRERVPLEVISGGEIAHEMVGQLDQEQLEAIAHGPRDRRWVLLEAPFDGLTREFVAAADELRDRGFAVVVAHPERVSKSSRTRRVLAHELAAGSVFQLTAGSFTGVFEPSDQVEAFRLLQSAPRVAIASDAHGEIRMPGLTSVLRVLSSHGMRDPARFVDEAPRALLNEGLVRRRISAAA